MKLKPGLGIFHTIWQEMDQACYSSQAPYKAAHVVMNQVKRVSFKLGFKNISEDLSHTVPESKFHIFKTTINL